MGAVADRQSRSAGDERPGVVECHRGGGRSDINQRAGCASCHRVVESEWRRGAIIGQDLLGNAPGDAAGAEGIIVVEVQTGAAAKYGSAAVAVVAE